MTQRGNNRQNVFHCDDQRLLYVKCFTEHANRFGVGVLGYCLMTNHVHLLLVPDDEQSLALTLQLAHSQYSKLLNQITGRTGHLWRNRFYSCPLDRSAVPDVLRYIELNPVRAGVCQDAWEWPWSSARAHVQHGRYDPVVTEDWREWLCGWDYSEWKYWLATGAEAGVEDAIRNATHKGCPYGSERFISGLELQTGRTLRPVGPGRPPKKVSDTISVGNGV